MSAMENPNYFAIIPADVRYDIKLKANAKLLYGEITALCGAQGFCWAQNDYFASLYSVESATVSRWISQLKNRGYIDVNVNKINGNKRRITLLTKKSRPIDKKVNTLLTKKSIAIDKKVKSIYENSTINNTSIIYIEKASLFLKENYPLRFQQEFEMRFKKQFPTLESYNSFLEDFDLTWDGKDYPKNLFGELIKYAKNKTRMLRKNTPQDEIKLNRPEFKRIG